MAPSRTAAVDPVFAGIAKAIYGDIDPRELIVKATPDTSDVHIPTAEDKKKERRLAATGLAATGISTAAGAHSVAATLQENRERNRQMGVPSRPTGRHRAPRTDFRVARTAVNRLKIKPKTAAIGAAAGMLGLHGVELVGDSLGIRAQANAYRDAQHKHPVSKAIRLKALNPAAIKRAPSLRAKRPKTVPSPAPPTTSAAGLYQPLGKAAPRFGRVRRTLYNAEQASSHARRAARDAADTARKVNRLVPSRKTAVAVGATGVGALAGGQYAASYYGTKRAQEGKPVVATPKTLRRKDSQPQDQLVKSVTWSGEISKVDTDKRQVFGWASVSEINGEPVVDLQGDIVPIDEIEKSAYRYVLTSRKGGDMHRRVAKSDTEPMHTSDLIESFVVTPEKLEKLGLARDALPHGWWVGFKVNDDDQWNLVKSGKRPGFSIHGQGTRTPVSKAASFSERYNQAVNPPKVKLHPVQSSFIGAVGYQPQTRRLTYRMKSGKEYTYKVSPRRGVDAVTAESKGGYFANKIKGSAKRSDKVSPAGRVRLFLNPQVSKAIPQPPKPPVSPTADKVKADLPKPPQPPKPTVLKPLAPSVGTKSTPTIAPPAKPPMLGGKVNGS